MGWDSLHCKWVATLLGTTFFFISCQRSIFMPWWWQKTSFLSEWSWHSWRCLLCLMWCSFVGSVRTGCFLFCRRGALLGHCLGMATTDLFLDTEPPSSWCSQERAWGHFFVASLHGMCLWPCLNQIHVSRTFPSPSHVLSLSSFCPLCLRWLRNW